MIKFEFKYNGKELIDKNGKATLSEVAQDICKKAKVELESISFLNSDKNVSVYDNKVTAREYISYIAESAGCFACINRKGKLCFRKFYQDETKIPLELFGEYKWGEEFKISKVSYEDGMRSFKFGDATRNNIWINQENMYIVDDDQVQKIYDNVKGLTVNTFEGKTIIDPAIDIGDKIIIDGKNVIYQGEMSLEGKFIAQISSKIKIKQKEETTVKNESQKVVNRRVQSRIDEENLKISQLIRQQDGTSTQLNELTIGLESTNLRIEDTQNELNKTIETLKQTIDGLTNTVENTGGSNIFYYDKEFWNTDLGNMTEETDTMLKKQTKLGMGYSIGKGSVSQTQQLQNGTYCISFLYKQLNKLANASVTINSEIYELVYTGDEWKNFSKIINVTSNSITIKFTSDTENILEIADLMGNEGEDQEIWTQNFNETRTDTVTIGKGIQVNSSATNTYTRIDSDGNRVYNSSTNEVVSEQTDKGTKTNELEVKNKAKITDLLIQKISSQVWLSLLD